jgi:hypothetical protein
MADNMSHYFDTADDDATVNLKMGGLCLRLMADFADKNPSPFRTVLQHASSNKAKPDFKKFSCMLLYNVCFADEFSVSPNTIRGLYSKLALEDLQSSNVVRPDGAGLYWEAKRLSSIPASIKDLYAESLVDMLCDKGLRKDHHINITTAILQQMVDASIFNENHWRRITKNRSASELMCKATLTPNILNIAGDRMLEMVLGSDLGL